MILQCPDCQTKMKPKPPADTKLGAKVSVTCRCGSKLRFTMPGKPVNKDFERQFREMIDGVLRSPGLGR